MTYNLILVYFDKLIKNFDNLCVTSLEIKKKFMEFYLKITTNVLFG